MMPPLGQPKPPQAEVDGLITLLETTLDRAGLAKPNSGKSSIHRLNRTEYGNAIRDLIEAQGAVPNIPAKSNRKWKPCFSKTLYRERNLIERFFNKIKHFRAIATRYDKLAINFLAAVQLVSAIILLN